MDSILTTLAMALDTLPAEGRVMLLAVLLSLALHGFTRAADNGRDVSLSYRLMYRKGALMALLLVPLLVYLTNLQMPVHVEQFVAFNTPVPAYVCAAVLLLWLAGAVVQLLRLGRVVRHTSLEAARGRAASAPLQARLTHWSKRLHLQSAVEVVCEGSSRPWHTFCGYRRVRIVIPAAALNWPVGVTDVMLLQQLAQIKQGAWGWLLFARVIRALYWPLPWVAVLARQLAQMLVLPADKLAAAAYRDAEGWQRDLRNHDKRLSGLAAAVAGRGRGERLLLADITQARQLQPPEPSAAEQARATVSVGEQTFERRWSGTKARLRRKYRDPHEQAYWLIAAACVAVGIATTLTVVQAPPEFDPRFLEVKWRDSMVRRIKDFDDDAPQPEEAAPAPESDSG